MKSQAAKLSGRLCRMDCRVKPGNDVAFSRRVRARVLPNEAP